MFELPEVATLSAQINQTLTGKVIRKGHLGNTPHKFVWYNRKPAEFERLTRGKTLGKSSARGKWLLLPLRPGYVLVFGEFGGKMLFHPAGQPLPKKYHLWLLFEDDSSLTVTTQMWGAMELYRMGEEKKREYIRGMRATPAEKKFSPEYFAGLVKKAAADKRSVKGLLTQDQLIPGLGNAIAQDILYRARLDPRRPLASLGDSQIQTLYLTIRSTLDQAIRLGGRNDEFDLFRRRGGYIRRMDKNMAGRPCPECGRRIHKIHYLGGACYVCPKCQR